jgi:HEAT repeat protein
MTVNVSVEAAVALVKIGEPLPEAIDLVKRAIDVPGEGVARYAIEAIPRLGDPGKPLVPLAVAKMGDLNPYTRYAAIWLVGQLPPAEATKYAEEVGNRATDEVPDIRRTVGRVLEKIGPAGGPAADAIGKALPSEKEDDIRAQYAEALVAMGKAAKPALPGMLPLVAGKGLPTALRAKVVVAAVVTDPASPEVAAAVLKAAADDVQEVRAAAAQALGNLNPLPPDALNTLVKLAKSDPKNGPRVAALRALAVAGPKAKAAVPEIDAIANGPQPGLAMWAKVAKAAVEGNIASAAPAIRKALTDRNVQVRAAAAESLRLIPSQPDDLPVLRKLLKDVNGPTRVAAAAGVGAFGAAAKDAVPDLRRLLNDRETEVRIAAADALGQIGPAAQPAVAKLKELVRFDPQVKSAAQRALDKIGAK